MCYTKSMQSKIISIVIGASLTTSAFADCQPVTPVNAGETAPCTGYIFTPEKERELRIMKEDYKALLEESKIWIQQNDMYKKEIEVTDQIVIKEQQKAELWRAAAETATEKYVKLEESRTTRDWIFLVSGVVLTVAAAWSMGQISK